MKKTNPLAAFAVERTITMGMIVLGVLVLGWISLTRLPLEFLPTFSSSSIWVSASYPSSSPEEIERLIVRPLEDSLGTINGIETMSASASSGSGSVSLTFVDGSDMDLAAVEVRDRVDRVRHRLPDDLERLTMRRFQSTDIPVLSMHLSAPWPKERLYEFVEVVVQRRLERLEGVAQVTVRGLLTPVLQIDLDPARLEAHGVSVRDLVTRIREDNRNLSAGEIEEGGRKLLVRAIGEMASVEEIRRMPVDDRGVVLGDVATVRYDFPEQEEFNFLNGREALTVRVNKASTANLLEVVDRVKEEIEAIRAEPEAADLGVRIYHDASLDVRQGLGQLRNAGLLGGGLAIMAVYFFLRRWRTTLLVAVAIPISVVFTFVLLYFLRPGGLSEITLNVVSLAGLMLALGMLVDNSIVVIESIFRHRNELGQEARQAALEGTSDVALPIIASTATTLCVFLPIVFMGGGGWMQTYFENIATTVCIVMVASLLVALTVVPLVAIYLLRRQTPRPPGLIHHITGGYGRLLGLTLHHRGLFVALSVLLLWGSIHLFGTIERSFGSRSEEREVTIQVTTPRQYSLEQTEALYQEVYEILDSRRQELDIADIAYEYDRGTGRSRSGWRGGRRIEIYLVDESEGRLTTAEARERIRPLLPTRAGVELAIAQGRGHRGSSGIEVELSGQDQVVLELLAKRLERQMAQVPLFRDVDTSLESGEEEIHVAPAGDRLLQAGLSSQAVAFTVTNSLSSRAVSHFQTGEREVDLVVQYREADRETLDQLKNLPVRTEAGTVPLGALAEFSLVAGPSSIERENHRSKVTVTANLADPRSSFAAMGAVGMMMESFSLPAGYEWSFGRWNRFQQESQVLAEFALVFALVLVYMLMAALFESFTQPFIIMLSVPFALLGVAVAMKLANQPLDTMSTIGVIILLGVVVNNAIVLVDHINSLRARGLSRDEAILAGGKHRLRPIVITAVTTILGLAPMVAPILLPSVFGPVEGRAGTWAPIGLVIIGGLASSTFLTLLVIPTIYSLIDDLANFFARVAAAVGRRPTGPTNPTSPASPGSTGGGRAAGSGGVGASLPGLSESS
ncbi:MAG: efflux RND transporter permease subunit [Thermoanaerobaculia bacterium]|nr:efflux RND transporter permease subunit [Thermoanaerobaculia bacterium]